MRFVLVLFLIQFLVPTFAQAGAQEISFERKSTLSTKHDSGISVIVLLKENTEEETEATKELRANLEIHDFAFLSNALTLSHSSIQWSALSIRPPSEHLYKLFCVFII